MPDVEVRVISGIELDRESVKLKPGCNKILRASETEMPAGKVQVVGGDSGNLGGAEGSPAIIIEKKDDAITKITVKCPCGRHSELVCEYGEEGGPQQ